MRYMHIPKTGGTALKNAFITNSKQPFEILSTHDQTIQHGTDWIVVLRDPWQRFCSAYWERRTNPLRKKINDRAHPAFRRSGYNNLSGTEVKLFEDYDTPEQLLLGIIKNPIGWQAILKTNSTLNQLFRPLSWYLGNATQLQSQQHRIHMAFELQHMNECMQTNFDLTMPTDPFLARNRQQFDFEQSYDISSHNLDAFRQLYADDYELIEYITTQAYYWRP